MLYNGRSCFHVIVPRHLKVYVSGHEHTPGINRGMFSSTLAKKRHDDETCWIGSIGRVERRGDMLKKCQQSSKTRTPQAENQWT